MTASKLKSIQGRFLDHTEHPSILCMNFALGININQIVCKL